MAIPGRESDTEIRGKIRFGIKARSQSTGREYPKAVDYFVSDDAEFKRLYYKEAVAGPSEIRIVSAFPTPEEFFSTGLEWWTQNKNGNHLACYTKDDGDKPIAHRSAPYLDPENEVVGEKHGSNRLPIVCPVRECRHFKKQGNKAPDCRPMARLTFHLVGEAPGLAPLQLDTKSWNSIDSIEKSLRKLDQFGTASIFILSVAFRTEGDNKFPVLSIREEHVDVNNDQDVMTADVTLALAHAYDTEGDVRQALADWLDHERPNWRSDERYIERIKEVGVMAAARKILEGLK